MSQHSPKYQKALDELLKLEFTGMKLGLDNIRELLDILGNPQKKFRSVHIAGSNGKGSVSAMLAAAMEANNFKTGLYTSPHLVDFRERIKINGRMIGEEYVRSFLETIWSDVERLHATFFEVTTAMAFSFFADSGVQIAIIETGLGGRLDATNILEKPLVTIITSISLEHTAQLGNTLEEIAGEKAGIMKTGVPTIVSVPKELQHVFLEKWEEIGAPVIFHDQIPIGAIQYSFLPFYGEHQKRNLHTVVAALNAVAVMLGIEDESGQMEFHVNAFAGIIKTKLLTGIRARLEEYKFPSLKEKQLRMFLDVAHNPDAFRALKEFFISQNINPLIIAGFAKDKDVSTILDILKEFALGVVTVAADSHRAMPTEELGKLAKEKGIKTLISTTPEQGVFEAITYARPGDTLLLTGSHYVVGDFLKAVES